MTEINPVARPADLLLTRLGIKYLIVEAKRPGARLAPARASAAVAASDALPPTPVPWDTTTETVYAPSSA